MKNKDFHVHTDYILIDSDFSFIKHNHIDNNIVFTFYSNYSYRNLDAIRWVVDSVNGKLGYRAFKISLKSRKRVYNKQFTVFRNTTNPKKENALKVFQEIHDELGYETFKGFFRKK